ncbi:hypothetical protein BDB01DRAFT_837200 [Pilobolus umbonatus]|nr:hypothetical protein BDB01DRAFT_837200 [Pilobolus umbonatus]
MPKRQRNSISKYTCSNNSDNDLIQRLEELVKKLQKENNEVIEAYVLLEEKTNQIRTDLDTATKENFQLKEKMKKVEAELEEKKEEVVLFLNITEDQSKVIDKAVEKMKKVEEHIESIEEEKDDICRLYDYEVEEFEILCAEYTDCYTRKEQEIAKITEEMKEQAANNQKQINHLMKLNTFHHLRFESVSDKYQKALNDLKKAESFERYLFKHIAKENAKKK